MSMTSHIVVNGELVAVIDLAPGVRLEGASVGTFGDERLTLSFTNWSMDQLVAAGIYLRREPTDIEKQIREHERAIAALRAKR